MKIKELIDIGGKRLVDISPSLFDLFSTVYPEYEWLPWQFTTRNYWESVENQRKFMDWAGNKLQIKEMSDWYNVSIQVYKRSFFQVEN